MAYRIKKEPLAKTRGGSRRNDVSLQERHPNYGQVRAGIADNLILRKLTRKAPDSGGRLGGGAAGDDLSQATPDTASTMNKNRRMFAPSQMT